MGGYKIYAIHLEGGPFIVQSDRLNSKSSNMIGQDKRADLERAKYHLSVKSVNLRNDESLPNDPYIYES